MKQKRKVFSTILLAVIMILATATTALAAGDGQITVENATEDKTYAAYKILDATYDENNTDAVAYTISESSPWYSVISNSGLFDLNAVPAEEGVYNVVKKSTTTDAQVTALVAGQFEKNATTGAMECKLTGASPENSATASEDGTLVIDDLPFGYYLITSSLGATVTIDTTNPTATVIDKNQGPTWDNEDGGDDDNPNPGKVIKENGEEVQLNAANLGDVIDFDIAINATNFVGPDQVSYYYICDTLSDGFDFDPTDPGITVTVEDSSGTHDVTNFVYTTDGDHSFQVAIPWSTNTLDSAGKIASMAPLYDANSVIHVTYSAAINAEGTDVVIGGKGNVNTANFTYLTEKPGDTPEEQPEEGDPFDPENPDDGHPGEDYPNEGKETHTYVFALAIQKLNEKGEALEGAVFTIKDDEGVELTALEKVSGTKGRYKYDAKAASDETEFEVNEDGVLIVEGLEEGTYTITEVKAPKGYNLLTSSTDYTIAAPEKDDANNWPDYTDKVITTVYFDADGKVVDKEATGGSKTEYTSPDVPVEGTGIINVSGRELPETGGIGTKIFYIVGGLLFVSACVLLIVKRRMSSEA